VAGTGAEDVSVEDPEAEVDICTADVEASRVFLTTKWML
jgi:hypothetical protein